MFAVENLTGYGSPSKDVYFRSFAMGKVSEILKSEPVTLSKYP